MVGTHTGDSSTSWTRRHRFPSPRSPVCNLQISPVVCSTLPRINPSSSAPTTLVTEWKCCIHLQIAAVIAHLALLIRLMIQAPREVLHSNRDHAQLTILRRILCFLQLWELPCTPCLFTYATAILLSIRRWTWRCCMFFINAWNPNPAALSSSWSMWIFTSSCDQKPCLAMSSITAIQSVSQASDMITKSGLCIMSEQLLWASWDYTHHASSASGAEASAKTKSQNCQTCPFHIKGGYFLCSLHTAFWRSVLLNQPLFWISVVAITMFSILKFWCLKSRFNGFRLKIGPINPSCFGPRNRCS